MWLLATVSDSAVLDYELPEGKNCVLSSIYLGMFNHGAYSTK